MKEIHEWKNWFGELAKQVNELSEEELMELSKKIDWGGNHSINDYPEYGIDPLSFLFFVASKFTKDQFKRVTDSINTTVNALFQLELPTLSEEFCEEHYMFPHHSRSVLFFGREERYKTHWKSGKEKCWEIFKQTVGGDLESDTFKEFLDMNIPFVTLKKITRTLFLINPEKFCPIDETGPLSIFEACDFPFFEEAELEIKNGGLPAYEKIMSKVKKGFPDCEFYEIKMLAHLVYTRKIEICTNYFYINAIKDWVPRGDDWNWKFFKENNLLRCGADKGSEQYEVIKNTTTPVAGDVILVKLFTASERSMSGKGIGVVLNAVKKCSDDRVDLDIDVLWINKQSKEIDKDIPRDWFGEAEKGESNETYNAFREKYQDTFSIIEKLASRKPTPNSVPEPQNADMVLNKIFYGPPGTGKTYRTIAEAVKIAAPDFQETDRISVKKQFDDLKTKGQIAFVTFHQSYGYEEFVEGIKPISHEGGIDYKVCDGVFKQICKEAEGKDDRFVLIIDEINRGNVSKIFGELITLIEPDKRIGGDEALKVKLPYSSTFHRDQKVGTEGFGVPSNLYIIGTMNTADRSLSLLDTALRRRFNFVEMLPEYDLLDFTVADIHIGEMLKAINQRIVNYNREQQIGHSYFLKLKEKSEIDELRKIFEYQILPLLEEYFFEDRDKVNEILNNNGFYNNNNKELERDMLSHYDLYQTIYK